MLTFMRKHASSWVIKILFAVLVMSFAVWGIGDIFRGPSREVVVATVGDVEISGRAFSLQYQRQIKSIRDILGANFTAEQSKEMGFPNEALATLVSRALYNNAANDIGIAVSDEVLRNQILEDESFRDGDGMFEERKFRMQLLESGFSEESFLLELKREVGRAELLDPINAGLSPPQVMLKPLTRYLQERRSSESVLIITEEIPGFDKPSDDDLRTYYEEHKAKFKSPEYRDISLLFVKDTDLTEQVEIAEETLQATYEERKDTYFSSEQRYLEQILVSDKATADKVIEAVNGGGDFIEIASSVASQEKDLVDIGWTQKEDLPEEIVEEVFTASKGKITPALESPFGWHVIRVKEISEEHMKPFEKVREEINTELVAEESLNALYELIKQVEDSFGGGAELNAAAEGLDLKVIEITAIDSDGKDMDGKAVENLPGKNFIGPVFRLGEGEQSDLVETEENGFYVARVNKIVEPGQLSFDQARDDIKTIWQKKAKEKSAKAQANLIIERVKGGEKLKKIAKDLGFDVTKKISFTRDDTTGTGFPAEMLDSLFTAKVGGTAIGSVEEGYAVGVLTKVVPASPDSEEDLEKVAKDLESGIIGDLVEQYSKSLYKRYQIDINDKALDSYL
ncbi:MAG: hypothetical protein HOI33_06810 [Rhodospirillaceae bacterium]|jgi:peptidyl-prolyl cis-trans isomerase D|nr:hypothetical protein [Rhodospirillaceae bacterium]